ncbi:HDIG domain-containing protein [Clostridia bacterium]|nr:HDIG domain-containing protein [Clostridia bacterium]
MINDKLIPESVLEVLKVLDSHGYRAYMAGECVWRLITGKNAQDFDIVTDAEYERIGAMFERYPTMREDRTSGEILVTLQGAAVLISHFRADFNPDGTPVYTESLEEDLARRDFTFTAMAYVPNLLSQNVTSDGVPITVPGTLYDPWGGKASITAAVAETAEPDMANFTTVCAIGEDWAGLSERESAERFSREKAKGQLTPQLAFRQNPFAILKCLALFASGEFLISEQTRTGIYECKRLLSELPDWAVKPFLDEILLGKKVSAVLEQYSDIFIEIIPELAMLRAYNQKLPGQSYDLMTHTFRAVGYGSPNLYLRYALLFHSLGMPDCRSFDGAGGGEAHYYGQEARAKIYAERIVRRLFTVPDEVTFKNHSAADNAVSEICFIIGMQNTNIGTDRREMKAAMRTFSADEMRTLLSFRYADERARSPDAETSAMFFKRLTDFVNDIVYSKECVTYGQLAVTAQDLIMKGLAPDEDHASAMIDWLLDRVVDNPALNNKLRLMDLAGKAINN